MKRDLINYLHILVIAPLVALVGYINLEGANHKVVRFMRSNNVSVALIAVAVGIILYHSTLLLNRNISGFAMRDNLRLESNQFVAKDAEAEGKEVDPQCNLAAFDSLPEPRKEGFAAHNLPLWGNREGNNE